MNIRTIVTIIMGLHDDGQSKDDICATLEAMHMHNDAVDAVRQAPSPVAATASHRFGAQPSVKYIICAGVTSKRIAALVGRHAQVATMIANAGKAGITKRDVLTAIRQAEPNAKPGVAMGAIHGLQTRGIVESVAIPSAPKPKLPTRAIKLSV